MKDQIQTYELTKRSIDLSVHLWVGQSIMVLGLGGCSGAAVAAAVSPAAAGGKPSGGGGYPEANNKQRVARDEGKMKKGGEQGERR